MVFRICAIPDDLEQLGKVVGQALERSLQGVEIVAILQVLEEVAHHHRHPEENATSLLGDVSRELLGLLGVQYLQLSESRAFLEVLGNVEVHVSLGEIFHPEHGRLIELVSEDIPRSAASADFDPVRPVGFAQESQQRGGLAIEFIQAVNE